MIQGWQLIVEAVDQMIPYEEWLSCTEHRARWLQEVVDSLKEPARSMWRSLLDRGYIEALLQELGKEK